MVKQLIFSENFQFQDWNMCTLAWNTMDEQLRAASSTINW
jgi:hypothetical protein